MNNDRRARKKLTTRRKARHTALSLFTANGFDNITVEQIADAADVSPMIFYRHLGTREAVIVDTTLTGNIGQAIHRGATLVPVAGTPKEVVGMVDSILDDSTDWIDDFTRRLKLVHDNPRLQDPLQQRTTVWIAALEALLASDGLGIRARARVIVGVDIEAYLAQPDREGLPSAPALHQCLQEAAEVLG